MGQLADIADLPAHLGVSGAGVEDHGGLVLQTHHFQHLRRGGKRVVTHEARRLLGLDLAQFDDLLLLRRAGAGALLVHVLFKTRRVHRQAALAGHEFGQVEGKALLIIKPKRERPRNDCRRGCR